MRVLVIEDDPEIQTNIVSYLTRRDYVVDCASDGIQGYALASSGTYDLVILDLNLPRMHGYAICRKLRAAGNVHLPVIMLTARDTQADVLEGFASGTDDFVIKPFTLAELAARIKALLHRAGHQVSAKILQVDDLEMDVAQHALKRQGQSLHLPPTSMKLLQILMQSSPAVVPRAKLEEALWCDSPPDSDSLRTHIHAIRHVIDKPFDAALLRTVRGVGYQLSTPHAAH